MTILRLAVVAALFFAGALFLGCGGDTLPPVDAGATSSSTGLASDPCRSRGDAGAGEPCASDCDCCGSACTVDGICAAPCP